LGASYLTLAGKAIKLCGGYIPAGAGKKAPANPKALFDNASLITGKAPPDGKSDKKS
jgi:hypothetical protein